MKSLYMSFRLCQTCKVLSAGQYENTSICAFLGYNAPYSGNFLTDISGWPIGPIFKGQNSWPWRSVCNFMAFVYCCILRHIS